MKLLVVILAATSIISAVPTPKKQGPVSSNLDFDVDEEPVSTTTFRTTQATTILPTTQPPNINREGTSVSRTPSKVSTNLDFETNFINAESSTVATLNKVTTPSPAVDSNVEDKIDSQPPIETTIAISSTESTTGATTVPEVPMEARTTDTTITESTALSSSETSPTTTQPITVEASTIDASTTTTTESSILSATEISTTEITTSTTESIIMSSTELIATESTAVSKPTETTTVSTTEPKMTMTTNIVTESSSDIDSSKPDAVSITDNSSTAPVTMSTISTDAPAISATNSQDDNQKTTPSTDNDNSKPDMELTNDGTISTTTMTMSTSTMPPTETPNQEPSIDEKAESSTINTDSHVEVTPSNTQYHSDAGHADSVPLPTSTEMSTKVDSVTEASSSVLDDIENKCNATVQQSDDKNEPTPIKINHNDNESPAGDTAATVTTISNEGVESQTNEKEATVTQTNILVQIAESCTEQESMDKNETTENKSVEITQEPITNAVITTTSTNEAAQTVNEINEVVEEPIVTSTIGSPSHADEASNIDNQEDGSISGSEETTTKSKDNSETPVSTSVETAQVPLANVMITTTPTNEASQTVNVIKEAVEEPIVPSTIRSPLHTDEVDKDGNQEDGSISPSDETTTVDPESGSRIIGGSICVILPLFFVSFIV